MHCNGFFNNNYPALSLTLDYAVKLCRSGSEREGKRERGREEERGREGGRERERRSTVYLPEMFGRCC